MTKRLIFFLYLDLELAWSKTICQIYRISLFSGGDLAAKGNEKPKPCWGQKPIQTHHCWGQEQRWDQLSRESEEWKMTRHQRAKKAEHRALLFLAITLVQLLAFKFLLRVQELCGNKIGDFSQKSERICSWQVPCTAIASRFYLYRKINTAGLQHGIMRSWKFEIHKHLFLPQMNRV